MLIKIKTAELLQSIGFALTSAQEELEGTKARMNDAIGDALLKGVTVPPEVQERFGAELNVKTDEVTELLLMQHMAKWAEADDQQELQLDIKSFRSLQYNLPAR